VTDVRSVMPLRQRRRLRRVLGLLHRGERQAGRRRSDESRYFGVPYGDATTCSRLPGHPRTRPATFTIDANVQSGKPSAVTGIAAAGIDDEHGEWMFTAHFEAQPSRLDCTSAAVRAARRPLVLRRPVLSSSPHRLAGAHRVLIRTPSTVIARYFAKQHRGWRRTQWPPGATRPATSVQPPTANVRPCAPAHTSAFATGATASGPRGGRPLPSS